MVILLITLRADHGGGPQHIDYLVNNYPDNIKLYMACPKDKPYYSLWHLNNKIQEIFELQHRKFSFVRLILLLKFIKKHKIRVIHSHGKGAGIYSRVLKILSPELKIIHTMHGFHFQEYGKLSKYLYITLERALALFTDMFINVSIGERDICQKYKLYPVGKSRVIYNGICSLEEYVDARNKIKLIDKRIVTTISRFDYPKNMDLAYQIAKEFKDRLDIVFLWIGDGKDKNEIEKRAKDECVNIIFTGFSSDISKYLSATDIYLSTSRWEGLPIALLEAQSLGVPIVATDVIGNNEAVVHGYNGYLFKDIIQACTYILKLLKNKDLYLELQKNARKNFENKFQVYGMVEQLITVYKEVGKR